MTTLLDRAVREFGLTVEGPGTQPDASSGAGIWRTASGFLKITPAGPAAERELRFYRSAAPVRTAALLGVLSDDSGVALLLEEAGAPLPPASWTAEMWAELGTALAALHSLPVPPGAPPPLPPLDRAFWAGRLPALPDPAPLLAATEALPLVFTHGDCHTANLLHGPDGLVLIDWQSAGPGRPGTDLAFPGVRAAPSGAVVPPALVDAYLAARPVDRDVLTRAVLAEELLTFLHHWPAYAPHNSPQGVERVVTRTRKLLDRWCAAPLSRIRTRPAAADSA